MNTLIALLIGFVSALFYSRGKADPVRSFQLDLKRLYRWLFDKRQESRSC